MKEALVLIKASGVSSSKFAWVSVTDYPTKMYCILSYESKIAIKWIQIPFKAEAAIIIIVKILAIMLTGLKYAHPPSPRILLQHGWAT